MQRTKNPKKLVKSSGSLFPPQVVSAYRGKLTIRYLAGSALTASALVVSDFMNLVCLCTTTSTNYQANDSVRIRKMELWSPASSIPGTTLLSFSEESAAGGVGSPSKTYTDMAMGADRPGHLLYRPSQGSVQFNWITSYMANATLFTLTCPAGTVVDLTIDYVLGDGTGLPFVAPAVAATGTTGQIMFRRLGVQNGLALVPQGVAYLA